MTTHSLPVKAVDRVEALHQTLRHLGEPVRLEESAWAGSNLVKQTQQRGRYLTPGQAVKAALSEQLARLALVDSQQADLLRGRFWEGLTVTEMVHAGWPEHQSERRFYEQQRQALQAFAALLDEAELSSRDPHTHSHLRSFPF
jgi:hypothetical protein